MKVERFFMTMVPVFGTLSGYSSTISHPKNLNVIYILADDLGYGDIGCYGQIKIQTPNIDRLASDGLLFTQHYAGSTVSAPSRSVLMTGQHTGHTPIRGNKGGIGNQGEGQHPLPADTYTLGDMFRQAGYATGIFGKWGLGAPGSEGEPNKQGFDEFFGYNCQALAHKYYPAHLWHNRKKIILKGNDLVHKDIMLLISFIDRRLISFEKTMRGIFLLFLHIPSLMPNYSFPKMKSSQHIVENSKKNPTKRNPGIMLPGKAIQSIIVHSRNPGLNLPLWSLA